MPTESNMDSALQLHQTYLQWSAASILGEKDDLTSLLSTGIMESHINGFASKILTGGENQREASPVGGSPSVSRRRTAWNLITGRIFRVS